MSWVLECERTTTGAERLVLLVLANHAHNDSWECWPSVELIGDEANIPRRRTVQAALADLEAKGLIERKINGAIDTRIPAGKRPTLYRIVGVAKSATPQPGGVENRRAGVSQTATQTVSEPSPVGKSPSGSHQRALDGAAFTGDELIEVHFERFWSLYPRKVDKGHARKAYRQALKRTDPDAIVAGVERYARSVKGKEPRFIAHAATWLNGDRWLDEPEASTPNGAPHSARLDTDRSTPSGVIDLRKAK